MDYFTGVLRKYAVFAGRARRAEFWWFTLFSVVIAIIISFIDSAIFGIRPTEEALFSLVTLYQLAILVPSLAVLVRRLHDTNRSGWWVFIGLIPFVGSVVLIVFSVLDSTPGENKYGPNPKGVTGGGPVGNMNETLVRAPVDTANTATPASTQQESVTTVEATPVEPDKR